MKIINFEENNERCGLVIDCDAVYFFTASPHRHLYEPDRNYTITYNIEDWDFNNKIYTSLMKIKTFTDGRIEKNHSQFLKKLTLDEVVPYLRYII